MFFHINTYQSLLSKAKTKNICLHNITGPMVLFASDATYPLVTKTGNICYLYNVAKRTRLYMSAHYLDKFYEYLRESGDEDNWIYINKNWADDE